MASGNKTVHACLVTIGLADPQAALSGCASLSDEFAIVKKAYFKVVLKAHPDKGGSAEVFREIQAAFEVLRELCASAAVSSLLAARDRSTADSFGAAEASAAGSSFQSWDFFAAAADEPVPPYKVELARSGRSKCQATSGNTCGAMPLIAKGAVRVGSLDEESGSYGRWRHLACWRVPAKVWLGLPDPAACADPAAFEAALLRMGAVLLAGIDTLPAAALREVAAHCMNKAHWAKLQGKAAKPGAAKGAKAGAAGAAGAGAKPAPAGKGAAASKPAAAAPKPGSAAVSKPAPSGGALVSAPPPSNALAGQTVVLTGIFPELGGGAGLNLGKDRARALVERFGGRVTSAVSGKTTMLLVGKEPGYSKVSQARARPDVALLDLPTLRRKLEAGGANLLEGPGGGRPDVKIKSFSEGYRGNAVVGRIQAAPSFSAPKLKAPAKAKAKPKAKAAGPARPTAASAGAKGRAADGGVPRPRGRAPAGKLWDSRAGAWMPDPSYVPKPAAGKKRPASAAPGGPGGAVGAGKRARAG